MDFVAAEKLIQLRWSHRRAGKHCVHLSTVMDLMLKQMREDAAHLVCVDTGSARHLHRAVESGVIELQTQCDQARIAFVLLARECRTGIKRLFRLEELARLEIRRLSLPAAFEHVDVEPVDRENVIERGLDRREKTGAGGDKISLRELRAGFQQTVIGPGVVVGHGREIVGGRGHEWLRGQWLKIACIDQRRAGKAGAGTCTLCVAVVKDSALVVTCDWLQCVGYTCNVTGSRRGRPRRLSSVTSRRPSREANSSRNAAGDGATAARGVRSTNTSA